MCSISARSNEQLATPFLNQVAALLNEMSTPIHCVLAPYGFDLETGAKHGELLYASSTLSLGAPLETLGTIPTCWDDSTSLISHFH
jgi:NAD(P)H-hydrate repair Nnr-like enzyme with NAD(P)H-hydrate epimerase domain